MRGGRERERERERERGGGRESVCGRVRGRERERGGGEVCERGRETSFFLSSFLRPNSFLLLRFLSFFLPSFSSFPLRMSSSSFLLLFPPSLTGV
jgi:hypothetical protein